MLQRGARNSTAAAAVLQGSYAAKLVLFTTSSVLSSGWTRTPQCPEEAGHVPWPLGHPQNTEAAGGHRPLGQTDTERRRLRSKLEQKDCVFIPTTLGLARGGSHTFWYLNLESRPRALRRPRSAWAHLQRGQAPAARPLLTPGQLLHGTNSTEAFRVSSHENRGEGARGCSGTARHLPTAQQRKGGG